MIKVAINGFGRIGRLVLRAGIDNPDIQFVGINDPNDPWALAHLLRHDSVHGRFPHELMAYEKKLHVRNQDIQMFSTRNPEELPWRDLDVDVAIECTGVFRDKEGMQKHLNAGAKKVLLSAPTKGNDEGIKTLVKGVNEHEYNNEAFVSNASCTTNCFAPMAKVIHDNYGIIGGVMTTVHSYTADQRTVDSSHKDLRRARAAAINIIPTSTGAATAVMKVIPNLKGKLVASAIRVPTPDSSLVSFVTELQERVNKDQVNELFRSVSEHHMKGILQYTDEPLVSTDIIGNPHSCVFDSLMTEVIEDNLLSVTGWYDNEWGYSNRMIDMVRHIMNKRE
ncbi:type I glyceraldehyde-3-phosphate dehydrogenase [Candidatus Woesearchaeota archaeon]|nr:type I glyceraldehyde-3-phosphate dehydrogenase [Candidatus Woesearchaeota archaeon]